MIRDVVPGAAIKSTLTSIQRSREALDRTSERLASGLRVNRAIDEPRNFFGAAQLNATASNFSSLLDKMNLGVRTIQQAIAGVEQMENILRLAQNKVQEAKSALEQTDSALSNFILAEEPLGYFQLYDSDSSLTAQNLGNAGVILENGDYRNGISQGKEILFYGAGGKPAQFDGGSSQQFVEIAPDPLINSNGPYDERTVELVFNADSVSGRQILWEEGGNVNNLSIYIDNGQLYVHGRTTTWGGGASPPIFVRTPIESGKTYHVAMTIDAPNNRMTGYLNGEAFDSAFIPGPVNSHPRGNGIGGMFEDMYFHDGPVTTGGATPDGAFAFDGQMSDVAIYDKIVSGEGMRQRYEATSLPLAESYRQEMQVFLEQFENLVEDTSYRGINLLDKETLVVDFNDQNTSKLRVKGEAFDLETLGLSEIDFQKPSQVRDAMINIDKAIEQVREFGSKLANDLTIIQTRQDFTRNFINNYKAGATDLTIADQNAEGARLLAQQTRLDLGTEALSLAGQSSRSILEIFGSGSDLFLL
jgi:flagellin-like hook-associated protein FlgL